MKKKILRAVLYLVIAALLVLLDQWTKELTAASRIGTEPYVLIPDVLELVYVENRGAAFGIGQGAVTFFAIVTPICLALVVYLYIKTPSERKFWPMRVCCMLVAAGAVGNFIDRVTRGYVVDMIYFKPIDFPVFNVADCFVTVSVFLLFFLLIFWKELGDKMFPEKPEKKKEA